MKQIGFKNFRRFANMHTLDLGDVNLLVGGNNSGKSTVVKALLLITENLRMLLRDSDYDMFLEERDEDGKRVKKQYRPEFNFAPNILHNALHIGTFERAINVGTSDDYIILSVSYGKINIAVEVARNSNDKNLPTSPIRKIIITDMVADAIITINYILQSINFTFYKDIASEMPGDLFMLFSRFMSPKNSIQTRTFFLALITKKNLKRFLSSLKKRFQICQEKKACSEKCHQVLLIELRKK